MVRWIRVILIGSFIITACSRTVEPVIQTIPTPIPPTSTPLPYPTATPFAQIFPDPNPELSLFTVHIEVVRVANDDGSDLANISPDEIIRLVDKANEIMAPASIRFIFDPQTDVAILQSTGIATMLQQGDTDWEKHMMAADQMVARYPGKITLFVRKLPVVEPSKQEGFFWRDYNFALISMEDQPLCGKADDTRLIRAMGHFLGLDNTFTEPYKDLDSAAKAYADSFYNLSAFDGDGYEDTPPEILIADEQYVCSSAPSILLENVEIPITRGNVMSGYFPRTSLTTQQIARARYILALRQRIGMIMPTNSGLEDSFEFESITNSYGWVTSEVVDLTSFSKRNFSGGKGLNIIAGYYSSFTVEFDIAKEGIYDLNFYGFTSPSSGVLEVYVDEYLVNDFIDLYGPYTYATGAIGMSPYYFTEGTHQMVFTVIKKNDLSTGYNFGLDAFTAVIRPQ